MRLRRIAEVRRAEWPVLLQLIPIAGALKLALYRVPLMRVIERVERLSGPFGVRLPLGLAAIDEHRLYQVADWATRLPAGSTPCLIRSLLLHLMLQQRGEASVIALGVAKHGAELRAHAWVTLRGRPIGESEAALAGFTPIAHLGLA